MSMKLTDRTRAVLTWLTGCAVAAASALVVVLMSASPASAATAGGLAQANLYKTAGYCANNPTSNSLGGRQFATSCDGHLGAGAGEYWCADFAKWVWQNSGFNVSGLTPMASSFYSYGRNFNTLRSTPQVGDAITFSYGGTIQHVGIVYALNSDGSIQVANGDWSGIRHQGESVFARSSSVVPENISARSTWVGSYAANEGYYIQAIIAPAGAGAAGSSQPSTSGNPYNPASLCGAGYAVIDSHDLGPARVYLLFDNGSGDNCVVTLPDADAGAVTTNATLSVQGGSSGHDLGSYHWYAGPVRESARNSCVQWGGQYGSKSWTSSWSHCGTGIPNPAPPTVNPYSPTAVCGSGYSIIDQHGLSGAEVFLLYNSGTGDNCVATMATDATSAQTMRATLTVQGGATSSNSGSYTYYAGPVRLHAPNSCVQWGGQYRSSSWTSNFGHCGSAATPNPYSATGVCGSGYSVIDSHSLGSATVYLLYDAGNGDNCVVTLAGSSSGTASMNARLTVQNGAAGSNPGLFQYYAGPIRLYAAGHCVEWGGSYESSSWTSGWSHCG